MYKKLEKQLQMQEIGAKNGDGKNELGYSIF